MVGPGSYLLPGYAYIFDMLEAIDFNYNGWKREKQLW